MALNVPRLHGPNSDYKADRGFIGGRGKNMNRKEKSSFRFGMGRKISSVSHPFRKVRGMDGVRRIRDTVRIL
jgi:hypothetical protein